MKLLLQDLRYAGRLLLKHPGFSLITILTLALGIGVNTAIFSIINAVLLTPLPYGTPDRLMSIFSEFPTLGFDRFPVSPPEYLGFQSMAQSFDSVGAYTTQPFSLMGRDEPVRVLGGQVTASLFTTLGVQPKLGRVFSAAEDVPHADPVVILSESLWHRVFGADPKIVGRRVIVDGTPRTVVGVLPGSFDIGGLHLQLYVPAALGPLNPDQAELHSLFMVGRLRSGTTLAQARAELEGMLERWPRELPNHHTPKNPKHRLVIRPMLDDLVGETRPKMRLLAIAVGFVLLVACANVASLLLARAEARQKEITLRTVLGARQGVLLRQFLTESVILALLGGALGLLLARWGTSLILAANPEALPRVLATGVDGPVLFFTLAASVVSGILFGLAPALYTRTAALASSLRDGGQRSTSGVARRRVRGTLVGVEIALAAALVYCGVLLLSSFWRLQQVNPGFQPQGLLSLRLDLPESTYPKGEQVVAFYDQLTARLSALPGVVGAAAMSGLPPNRSADSNATIFESIPADPHGPPQSVDYWQYATADYFRTMKIPLISGRLFNASDNSLTPPVTIVNETMAKVFWPGKSPLGQRLRATDHTAWMTIVGVVGDVKQGGLQQKTGTEMYFLESQSQATVGGVPRSLAVVVRASGDLAGMTRAVRSEIRRMDPALPVDDVLPMTEVVSRSMDQPRFLTLLVTVFSAIALVLAAIGIYGLLAFTVAARTREFGVRMALGADGADVLLSVLRQGAQLVIIGLTCGVVGSLALGRLLSGMLFGVKPSDPLILGAVVAVLSLVALLACYVPARRATRVDPLIALRQE
ncbi:MAG TPA: ABC transporter permease [Thermoanaerobaculia bacterium]|jgi:putative ABC transport system permease protein|nr:ABC transporter permease [Thermoanaerobaculia bacterium]